MSRNLAVAALCASLLMCVVVTMCGCGEAPNPLPLGRVEIPLQATVSVAPLEVREIVLTTPWPGDRFEAEGATARIQRPDGTSAPMSLDVSADRRTITLGPAAVVPAGTPMDGPSQGGGDPGMDTDASTRLDLIVIDGPLWMVNGKTGARTEIGRIRFGFEVLQDGTVVAPKTVSLHVPASGMARVLSVSATGLKAGDFVKTRIVENAGPVTVSAVYQADVQGSVTVRDALKGVDARRLSGPGSSLGFYFARTDADGDGVPDLF